MASSLNIETWGILCLYPDWRWGEFNKFNPYNKLKLFNQEGCRKTKPTFYYLVYSKNPGKLLRDTFSDPSPATFSGNLLRPSPVRVFASPAFPTFSGPTFSERRWFCFSGASPTFSKLLRKSSPKFSGATFASPGPSPGIF